MRIALRALIVTMLSLSTGAGIADERTPCKESLRSLHALFKRVVQTGDVTQVDGTWRSATADTSEDWVTHGNAVRVECRRTSQRCTEFIALINDNTGTIETFIWPYTIREWSASTIRATAEPGAVDLELVISPTTETASRTLHETTRHGITPSHPGRTERWSLK